MAFMELPAAEPSCASLLSPSVPATQQPRKSLRLSFCPQRRAKTGGRSQYSTGEKGLAWRSPQVGLATPHPPLHPPLGKWRKGVGSGYPKEKGGKQSKASEVGGVNCRIQCPQENTGPGKMPGPPLGGRGPSHTLPASHTGPSARLAATGSLRASPEFGDLFRATFGKGREWENSHSPETLAENGTSRPRVPHDR